MLNSYFKQLIYLFVFLILSLSVYLFKDNLSNKVVALELKTQIGSQESSVSIEASQYELIMKRELIKKELQKKKQINSDTVNDILASEVQMVEMVKIYNDYFFTTNIKGVAEGMVANGTYLVSMEPIPSINVQIPESITLTGSEETTIGVATSKGEGKVDSSQVTLTPGKNTIKTGNKENKVQIVIFKDVNSNGFYDEREQLLPWAGIQIKLTKVNKEKEIYFNAGWNLVSLTVLPSKALTASSLIDQINSRKGTVTTVSTLVDGAWKSYVQRDGNSYSVDDFAIEVGKAYFVKALKKSTFTYTGQNLVAPVKLKLASGWNAVGIPYSQKSYQADTLIEAVKSSGAESDALSQWDFGLWDTFVKKEEEGYGNNFDIINNKGYLVRVKNEGEWSP